MCINEVTKDERCGVKTVVSGEEFLATKRRMVRVFTGVVMYGYREGRFPHWGDSVRQLIENAWVLWKWRAITDPETGRPFLLHKLAEVLCRNLHVRMPANVSSVAHESLHSRRKSVVDYYAMLWRESGTDASIFIEWQERIKFPKIVSYRGLFD